MQKGSYGTIYIEQSDFKLDPTVHSYVHITYKNLSKPNENNEIQLDWIESGTTRSDGQLLTIETSTYSVEMPEFLTVSYNLGADTEWIDASMSTIADATNFRVNVRRTDEDTKSGDLLIDSIIFNNTPPETLSTNNFKYRFDNLSIYPNPFKDSFTYKFDSNLNESANVELFTITGRRIKTINNTANGNTGTVNTSHLSKGMYFVRITSGKVKETKRLIKN